MDLNEMMQDLAEADNAGDTELANHIATLIKQEQNKVTPVEAQPEQMPQDDYNFSLLNMMKNGPASVYNVGKDVVSGAYQAVTNPVQTAKGIRDIGQGIYSQYQEGNPQTVIDPLTGESRIESPTPAPYMDKRPAADAFKNAITRKYENGFLPALENDPAGVMMDASMIMPQTAMTNPAALNPISQGFNAVRAGKEVVLPAAGRNLYETTAKLGTTLTKDQRARMVDTALDNDLPPTQAGVQKLDSLADDIHRQIDSLVSKSVKADEGVPVSAVFRYLKQLRQEKGGIKIDSKEDLAAIDAYAKKLKAAADKSGKSHYTAADLQVIKKDLYEKINWKAKRMTDTPIEEGIYKNIARGAKEGVEELVPKSKALNAEWGKLLELKPELQRAANRIENRDIVSLSSLPLMIGGGIAGDLKGAAAGLGLSALLHPKVSGAAAIWLNKAGRRGPLFNMMADSPNVSRAEYVSYSAAQREKERERKRRRKEKTGIYN